MYMWNKKETCKPGIQTLAKYPNKSKRVPAQHCKQKVFYITQLSKTYRSQNYSDTTDPPESTCYIRQIRHLNRPTAESFMNPQQSGRGEETSLHVHLNIFNY